MNILYINSYDCSPLSSGGVNRVVNVLSDYLSSKFDYKCFLGFFEEIEERPLAHFEGRIKLCRNLDKVEFRTFLVKNEIQIIQVNFLKKHNLPVIADIYNIAKEQGIKVIYAFHMCPGFQTVTYGSFDMVKYCLKYRHNLSGEFKKYLLTLLNPILSPVQHTFLRSKYLLPYLNSDKTVLLSNYYTKPYMDIAGIKDASKLTAIGNCLTFDHTISKEKLSEKEKEIIIVARFDEDTKRLSLALKAWSKIEEKLQNTEWHLTLVGDGRDIDYYKYLVTKLNLKKVSFTGYQSPEKYYDRASIFLMTSSAEGWPMVLMEACQKGVVTIAMDSFGSLHDIIIDGYNGAIVPNNDTNALANAIRELTSNAEKRHILAENAIESSRRFTIDKISNSWNSLFNEILK